MTDSGQKFAFSPFYSLPAPSDFFDFNSEEYDDNEEFQQLKNGELYLLRLNPIDKFFLINPTIYFFLHSFKSPTTLEDVSILFAKEANCTVAEIEPYMTKFLQKMLKRHLLVKEETLEKIADFEPEKSKDEYVKYETGDKFQSYTIHSLLSMRKETQLYLLEDINKDILVLKISFLHPDMPVQMKEKIKAKFRKEFEMLEELKGHPSICTLKTFDDSTHDLYAIMEYIDGVSLRKYVNGNNLTLIQKLDLVRSIIDIIRYIQSKGILHGDIHNSNFMVNSAGELKIIDFGLSNHVQPDEDEILRNGGKSSFIPPERISLNSFEFLTKRADFASEVFQLGVLAYFVLYRDMPFKGFTWKSLALNIMNKDPEFKETASDSDEKIPDQLISVLKKSMAKDPSDRFESAASFLAAYDQVMLQETTKEQ